MKWWAYIFFAACFIIVGYLLNPFLNQKKNIIEPFAKSSKCAYVYLNPRRCEPELALKKKEYVALRSELNDLIAAEKKSGKLSSASIYFRDLQNGPILNINEQEAFIPASLLKLPLLITYYKKAEEDPQVLTRKVTASGEVQSLPQNVKPEETAQIGKEYSIDQLITILITYSDNISWKVLLGDLRKNYSEDDFVSTLSDLGIVDPRKRNDQQYITVQNYASIFRILYNSSYLNLEMSNKALELLTKSSFKDGLVAGVPNGVMVAHKFGEQKNGEEQQLHDCGIVYYPPNPYIICIMTRGTTIADLEKVIQTVSTEVYKEVESRNAD